MEHTEKPNKTTSFEDTSIAEISEICCRKISECERELNKQGYWNIALVAYQLKEKE